MRPQLVAGVLLTACTGAPSAPPPAAPTTAPVAQAEQAPPPQSSPIQQPRYLVAIDPPAGTGGLDGDYTVAAQLFAFSDSQLHYMFGKRTFAQSPFADSAVEVAVRPAAQDDGSDLLLQLFLQQQTVHYPDHTRVFLGDAADLSCTQEFDAFTDQTGLPLLALTSNHDGFFVGNYTSRADVDGMLEVTDMPHDWTRACSDPGSQADRRLTRGRAVERISKMIPAGEPWATAVQFDGAWEPHQYAQAYLYYVRPLNTESSVWGVFLDTADYRSFDLRATKGAGTVGAVSREQLRFLDRGMFEANGEAYLLFGHHPLAELSTATRKRLLKFLDEHPKILAYVSAHTHISMEKTVRLPSGRQIMELVVGSTFDAPQAARLLEVQLDRAGNRRAVASRRLVINREQLCAGIKPMAPTSTGYTGYRILRDGTPELDIGVIEGVLFKLGMDDLAADRLVQSEGALLIENELVRSWAKLYLDSPLQLSSEERAQLEAITGRRYAAGDTFKDLVPYLRGSVRDLTDLTYYDRWHDPVNASILAVAERGVHRFGPHRELFSRLRSRRTDSTDSIRYFACHALYASDAEIKSRRKVGDVLYVR